MKKFAKLLLKIVAGFIIFIFLLLLIVPVLFKKQIKEQVVKVANENIEASFAFEDFGVSLIRHFPNFSFSLKDVSIVGIGSFEGDTLAGFKSFSLVFDLSSLLGKEGYNVRSIIIDSPVANAIVLADGSANWDIMKESAEVEEQPADTVEESAAPAIKLRLQKFEVRNANISYNDYQSGMMAGFDDLDMRLSGNMSAAQSDLLLAVDITGLNYSGDGIKYVNDASLSGRFDVIADLENNRFELGRNSISLNEIVLSLTGSVAMSDESIETNLSFATGETKFKEVLSLVPAFYMKGYENLKTDGTFGFSGTANGIYNSADSIYPDISIDFYVKNGVINYPDLPEKITDININFKADVEGANPDRSVFNLEKFHFSLAGNPFDFNFRLMTPLSDPDFSGSAKGRIDLGSLASAVPVENLKMSGIIDMALSFAGRYSMVEEERYEDFKADGNLNLSDIAVAMDGIPPVSVSSGSFLFSPRFLALNGLSIDIAGSDIYMAGRIDNYIAWALKGETIVGMMTLNSRLIDAGKIMSFMPADTMVVEEVEEEIPLPDIRVPANIDFRFSASIVDFVYPPLSASNLQGNIIVRDGTVRIEDTGFETLGGAIELTALFDTRDSLNPVVKGSFSASDIGIKPAFDSFNTVKKLAPVAEGMEGDVSVMFEFSSSLGKGMMPITDSIAGKGKFTSDEITLVSSPVFEKFQTLFKLDDSFTNSFRDVDVEFRVEDGRVHIKPFDTKMGVIKMNIGGSHGLDQSLSYVVKSEMPSKYLPESLKSVINSLSAQAALLGLKYEQPENIKVNLAIGGTVKDPMIMPTLGGLGDGTGGVKESAKEAAKEAVEKVVDETKEKVSDALSKEAEKIIADAEVKADQVRSEAARAAQAIRDEAEKNAAKLTDEAASKGALAKIAADRAAAALRKEADKKALLLVEEADKKATLIIDEAKKKAEGL